MFCFNLVANSVFDTYLFNLSLEVSGDNTNMLIVFNDFQWILLLLLLLAFWNLLRGAVFMI